MKAFWWFKENSVAGMARPGFNSVPIFHLPFEVGAVVGWLGQHSSPKENLASLRQHLVDYVPRIYKFYGLNEETGPQAIAGLASDEGLRASLALIKENIAVIKDFDIIDDHLHITWNTEHLDWEATQLKSRGISRIVALTEKHHHRDLLEQHFKVQHIAIDDLGAPKVEQVHELVETLQESKVNGEKVVVHCLAGIGRTSTMLMAAHILMGEKYDDLKTQLMKQNPRFILTGVQDEFVRSLCGATDV